MSEAVWCIIFVWSIFGFIVVKEILSDLGDLE